MRVEIPNWLLGGWRVHEFVNWLNKLQVERKIDRKIIMCEWCKMVGYPLTRGLIARVYTHP